MLIFVGILYLSNITCSKNDSSLFGESQESPIKKEPGISKVVDMQNTFRAIYDLYKDRVVSISTEQTVKVQSNPFFNDPFFRDFFGTPDEDETPRSEKRQGLGSGFILSADGYICTDYHVIKGVDKVTVKVNNKSYNAKIIGMTNPPM